MKNSGNWIIALRDPCANWSIQVRLSNQSLSSLFSRAQWQAETHFVVAVRKHLYNWILYNRDFLLTAKCSFFPLLQSGFWFYMFCSFLHCFLKFCFYFCVDILARCLSHGLLLLMSCQNQRPISMFHCLHQTHLLPPSLWHLQKNFKIEMKKIGNRRLCLS